MVPIQALQSFGVKVFITNISTERQAKAALEQLEKLFPELRMNTDVNDTPHPYPCGHTILRVEGQAIPSGKLMEAVKQLGFACDMLEDKVCR